MSDTDRNNKAGVAPPVAIQSNPFSNQATGLLETTFAETLGLSMHNAVSNQQSSQMTTSASVTNACARLLKAPSVIYYTEKNNKKVEQDPETQPEKTPEKKSLLKKISHMFKKNKKADKKETGEG